MSEVETFCLLIILWAVPVLVVIIAALIGHFTGEEDRPVGSSSVGD